MILADDYQRKTRQQIGQYGKKSKNTEEKEQVSTSIREDAAGEEQPAQKKQ